MERAVVQPGCDDCLNVGVAEGPVVSGREPATGEGGVYEIYHRVHQNLSQQAACEEIRV